MAFVHRTIGRVMKRTEDGVSVGAVIQDILQTDDFLEKLLLNTKAWRDAWTDILSFQGGICESYITVYQPVPTVEEPRYQPAETPPELLQKVERYQSFLKELRGELIDDVTLVERTVVDPLNDLRKYVDPLKKALKKRENRKLDYERHLRDVENMKKKRARSDRENATLAKSEQLMESTGALYQAEDERIIEWAPPILAKVSEAMSYVLQTLITAQVSLLARSYTVFLEYSRTTQIELDHTDRVIEEWEEVFEPIKRHLENEIATIKQGKAVRMPMSQLVASKSILPLPGKFKRGAPPPPPPNPPAAAKPLISRTQTAPSITSSERTEKAGVPPILGSGRPSLSGRASSTNLSIRSREESPPPPLPANKPPPPIGALRPQKSFSNLSVYEGASRPLGHRIPSTGSANLGLSAVNAAQDGKPEWARLRPTSSSSRYSTNSDNPHGYAPTESSITSFEDARSQFGGTVTKSGPGGAQLNQAIESSLATKLNTRSGMTNHLIRPKSPGAQSVSSVGTSASAIAAKKKPPPPPPKPKAMKKDDGEYVIALYNFEAQAASDLAFKEGNKIKVTKKTDSTDDWWEGELDGRKGEFPANYTMKA